MIRFVTIPENNFKSYELSVTSFIMWSPIWNAKEWKGDTVEFNEVVLSANTTKK